MSSWPAGVATIGAGTYVKPSGTSNWKSKVSNRRQPGSSSTNLPTTELSTSKKSTSPSTAWLFRALPLAKSIRQDSLSVWEPKHNLLTANDQYSDAGKTREFAGWSQRIPLISLYIIWQEIEIQKASLLACGARQIMTSQVCSKHRQRLISQDMWIT